MNKLVKNYKRMRWALLYCCWQSCHRIAQNESVPTGIRAVFAKISMTTGPASVKALKDYILYGASETVREALLKEWRT